VRVLVVAHAATPGTRAAVFGDQSLVSRPGEIPPLSGRVAGWLSGPEPACPATAVALGAAPPPARTGTQSLEIVPELAGPDFGGWAGRPLGEIAVEDPAGVQAWLTTPDAAPYGGESVAALVARVGAWADARPWPAGQTVMVVTGLVARALAVHALGAPPSVLFRLDVGPLDRLHLSRTDAGWRVRLG